MWGYWKLSLRLLLFGVFTCISLGALSLVTAYYWSRNASDFEEHGDVVRARIREQEPRPGGRWVRFEYLDEAGKLHAGEQLLTGPTAAAAETAGFIELRFDKRNPDRYELATSHARNVERSARFALWGLAVLLLGGAAGLLCWRALAIWRMWWLVRSGFPVETTVRTQEGPSRGQAATRFTYAYQGPNGRWYEGSSPQLPADQLARYPVGAPIRIVFDKKQPRRSQPDLFGVNPKKRRAATRPTV